MQSKRPPTVVAIPAKDEGQRIGACLRALLDQREFDGRRLPADAVRIVVLANNCRDDTAAVARAVDSSIVVKEVALPPDQANAGAARRGAMDAASAMLPGGHGLICSTDADSRPRRDWIVRLWAGLQGGAEAVAGAVEFDPLDRPAFNAARRLEARYSALQAEIIARLDPEAHNPWPNHIWAWGANLAVTSRAYRRVGGMTARPLAEDRAFVERLRLFDVPVRHCLDARVWTSARQDGRAPGGLASLVRDHLADDSEPCDAALEPAGLVWRRASWRARLRAAYARGEASPGFARRLGVTPALLSQAMAAPTFGAGWATVEAASPLLAGRRLRADELSRETAAAERLLRRFTPGGPADPDDRIRAASAGLWSEPAA